ncbi:hypothetical protein [Patulibacter minatonensis]|uniref:hypothetical protein n=1 Tax=Patulibacter minatonensis TaxID=298163 RepID=UPI0006891907|nr:hypothetical protein [Patulibacter minatonensis]
MTRPTPPAAPLDVSDALPRRTAPVDPFATTPLTNAERRARRLARNVHRGQLDERGRPLIEHVERVAADVPPSARTVAFVHDVCARSGASAAQVARVLDLDEDEREALVLLTRRGREPLTRHVRRVVRALPDPARELALVVLRADVEDLAARAADGDGPYGPALEALDEAGSPLAVR